MSNVLRTYVLATMLIASLVALSGCAFGEPEYVDRAIRSVPGVTFLRVYGVTGPIWWPHGGLYVDAIFQNETFLSFFEVGFSSIGPGATELVVDQIGELSPVSISCLNALPSTGPERWNPQRRWVRPDFHANGRFGAHVSPGIVDLVDAVKRHQEIRAALLRWPRCPSYWEFADAAGTQYRYCANVVSQTRTPIPWGGLPPWPAGCE